MDAVAVSQGERGSATRCCVHGFSAVRGMTVTLLIVTNVMLLADGSLLSQG